MSDAPNKQVETAHSAAVYVAYAPYVGYMVVAGVSALASIIIAGIALNKFTQVTDSGIWAMAAMIFAPALMGVGVAVFIYKTSCLRAAWPVRNLEPPAAAEVSPHAITSWPGRPGG